MRVTETLRASVVLAALATGSFGGVAPATLAFGIGSAEAKELYTRKRVRGRWVRGHFTRRHSAATRRDVEPDARLSSDNRPQDDPLPATAALKPNFVAESRNPADAARPVGVGQTGASAALLDAEPLARDERLKKLQAALHTHARNMASNTEAASGGLPTPGGLSSPRRLPTSPEPKAVSFDFQSGLKTTVFTDGTQVEEPFDPMSMKGLAATGPNLASSESGR